VIRVEENHFINHLVQDYLIPESIRETNPILAGGSILYLYLNYSDESSFNSRCLKSYLQKMKRLSVKKDLSTYYRLGGSIIKNGFSGDIDIWYSSNEDFDQAMAAIKTSCRERNSTNWAVTYDRGRDHAARSGDFLQGVREIQIIKKIAESPEDLISSFDIANSMIAWQDGKLYVDSRLDEAFSDGEVRYVNNPFNNPLVKEMTIGSKLFNALRLFKYAKRYNLSFSKEIDEVILKVFLEAEDIDLEKYDKQIEVASSHYGKRYASINTVKSMIHSLAANFPHWYVMNTFREENLAFFVALEKSELSTVTDFVKRALGAKEEAAITFSF